MSKTAKELIQAIEFEGVEGINAALEKAGYRLEEFKLPSPMTLKRWRELQETYNAQDKGDDTDA